MALGIGLLCSGPITLALTLIQYGSIEDINSFEIGYTVFLIPLSLWIGYACTYIKTNKIELRLSYPLQQQPIHQG